MSQTLCLAQPVSAQGWKGSLHLDYRLSESGQTTLRHHHTGPMRVFKSLYPQGPQICQTVLIHPPGGLVGGDVLNITAELKPGAHALISTPGATRFYASDQHMAAQQVQFRLHAGSRLEWCPLETLAYPGCKAHNHLSVQLDPGAEMIGWDVTSLGLPASDKAFDQGIYTQTIEIEPIWLEQARIDAHDRLLMNGKLGLNGYRALGTCWFASGSDMPTTRIEQLTDACRTALPQSSSNLLLGVTAPNPQVVVVRALSHQTEPILQAFQAIWRQLRPCAWGLEAEPPRIWQV